jgi:hypothetical protein
VGSDASKSSLTSENIYVLLLNSIASHLHSHCYENVPPIKRHLLSSCSVNSFRPRHVDRFIGTLGLLSAHHQTANSPQHGASLCANLRSSAGKPQTRLFLRDLWRKKRTFIIQNVPPVCSQLLAPNPSQPSGKERIGVGKRLQKSTREVLGLDLSLSWNISPSVQFFFFCIMPGLDDDRFLSYPFQFIGRLCGLAGRDP